MSLSLHLSQPELERLFPAYLAVDDRGVITGAGPSLTHHLGGEILGAAILDQFEVARPLRVDCVEKLLIDEQIVLLRHRRAQALELQGMILASAGAFFFLVSHGPAADRKDGGVAYRFSDFAPFDGSKDLFLASQIRTGLLKDAHELVEQLKLEKQAAEAANAAKGEFLACMSHEVRTPLNGVLGLGALLERTELDDDQRMMLQSLRDCGASLLETLNDIIDISKMDAGLFDIVTGELKLDELAGHLRSSYGVTCKDKNIALQVRVQPELAGVTLIGDAARIRQILNNLVSNAVKFTEAGSISVTISNAGRDHDASPIIRFRVEDTGIGVSEEDCAKIFEPFVQADAGITRAYGGTGLGLSICRRLCEMMGGEIGVTSQPGAGSAFTFSLPLPPVGARMAAAASG